MTLRCECQCLAAEHCSAKLELQYSSGHVPAAGTDANVEASLQKSSNASPKQDPWGTISCLSQTSRRRSCRDVIITCSRVDLASRCDTARTARAAAWLARLAGRLGRAAGDPWLLSNGRPAARCPGDSAPVPGAWAYASAVASSVSPSCGEKTCNHM
jgi:hypothetical protein